MLFKGMNYVFAVIKGGQQFKQEDLHSLNLQFWPLPWAGLDESLLTQSYEIMYRERNL